MVWCSLAVNSWCSIARKVTPGAPAVAGARVQVSDWQGQVRVWQQGTLVLTVTKRTRSGTCVPHPDQFRTVVPAAAARRASVPLGHQIPAPVVTQCPLSEYDQLCGVVGIGSVGDPAPAGEWTGVAG